ncbi:MAG: PHP domain-containing protein, partial [Alphaproteobacteria bacterium]
MDWLQSGVEHPSTPLPASVEDCRGFRSECEILPSSAGLVERAIHRPRSGTSRPLHRFRRSIKFRDRLASGGMGCPDGASCLSESDLQGRTKMGNRRVLLLIMFSEFHARSAFSFLRGTSCPKAMVKRAAELGYKDIAFTDHGGFYGSARAHNTIKDLKAESRIRAVVGATLDQPDGSHLPVLCATRNSYRVLSRHLTDLHLKDQPEGDLHDSGLIALTGDRDGPLIRHLLRDNRAGALAAAKKLINTFGLRNVFVEINRHRLRDDGRINRYLTDLAEYLHLPILASNAPLHISQQNRLLADAFTCLRHHVSLDQAGKLLLQNSERHMRSPKKMKELFADLPAAVANTQVLSERIDFSLENLGYEFPDYTDEHNRPLSLPEQMRKLAEMTFAKAGKRFKQGASPAVIEQLTKELKVIDELGFPGYFLIVWDLMEYARKQGIMCQGRGSAANSAVCYALEITNVDPIENKLLFERFLNASRKGQHDDNRRSWPDIDI